MIWNLAISSGTRVPSAMISAASSMFAAIHSLARSWAMRKARTASG